MLEMMSVVLILGVIATMSVVGFRKAINHQRLVGESNNAAAAVRYIASEARVSKQRIRVMVDYDNNIIIGWIDTNNNNIPDTGETVINKFEPPEGVEVFSGFIGNRRFSGKHYFTFFEDGTASTQATIAIKAMRTEEYRTITVNPSSGWVEIHNDAPSSLKLSS